MYRTLRRRELRNGTSIFRCLYTRHGYLGGIFTVNAPRGRSGCHPLYDDRRQHVDSPEIGIAEFTGNDAQCFHKAFCAHKVGRKLNEQKETCANVSWLMIGFPLVWLEVHNSQHFVRVWQGFMVSHNYRTHVHLAGYTLFIRSHSLDRARNVMHHEQPYSNCFSSPTK